MPKSSQLPSFHSIFALNASMLSTTSKKILYWLTYVAMNHSVGLHGYKISQEKEIKRKATWLSISAANSNSKELDLFAKLKLELQLELETQNFVDSNLNLNSKIFKASSS